ncbi:signal peptide peptidase SppA [archaeon]|jgi:protease IV|nr:signal peptide peptidase SppA [archaeon]MBT3730593.1 signal peptide peptidase SppA [archaeon]MBT4669495.1 signal peptide peptidase SppA [archaeon]MBT5030252.1 signal peptide peptidase SppA [archaeon]MBT5287649.1 signal peptide peptidase SppA [archaeon]
MNKLFKVLFFLAFLWILSYGIAYIVVSDNTISSEDTIAVIPINGMITLNGGSTLLQSSTSANTIVEKINEASANENVKAIVFEINSPGGTVMGSKKLADAIDNIEKPTVAVITEYGTSGAYWAASQTDYIIADELSIVGSISVLGSYLDFSGLLNDYNITYQRLVTGDYKDLSSPYKELTDDERDLLMLRLDAIHDYFVDDVAEGRSMSREELDELSEGLFYIGLNSIDIGLIDGLGDKDTGIEKAKELSNVTNGEVTEYTEEESWFDSFMTYSAYSSFHIGQGIGSVIINPESNQDLQINL